MLFTLKLNGEMRPERQSVMNNMMTEPGSDEQPSYTRHSADDTPQRRRGMPDQGMRQRFANTYGNIP